MALIATETKAQFPARLTVTFTLKASLPHYLLLASTVVKNSPANAADTRDPGSIPGLGRSPGQGKGNLLQYSCLEDPMDRGTWWATVHRVAKSRT